MRPSVTIEKTKTEIWTFYPINESSNYEGKYHALVSTDMGSTGLTPVSLTELEWLTIDQANLIESTLNKQV